MRSFKRVIKSAQIDSRLALDSKEVQANLETLEIPMDYVVFTRVILMIGRCLELKINLMTKANTSLSPKFFLVASRSMITSSTNLQAQTYKNTMNLK